MTLQLRPYQIEGRDFLAARRFALLADEMRVGKTPQAILAAVSAGVKRLLVICPAIAVPQWHEEIKRWWRVDYLSIAIYGSDTLHYEVLSYDKARTADPTRFTGWDVAIVDECHFAKNPQAARTKAIFGKDGIGWQVKRLWCLSGTPATRHAGELYPMMKAFGITTLSYTDFCARYCEFDWTGRIVGTKTKHIPELKRLLAKFMLRRTRKQVAPEMPEIAFEFLAVDPVSKVDLPQDCEAQVEAGATTPFADFGSRREVALSKALPLVEEIAAALERGDYKQTVVFAWHRDAIEAVRAGLCIRGIDAVAIVGGMTEWVRTERMKLFQEGEIQVVVAQILAAGTAIDLSAASHGYFLELSWVPAENIQAANRLVSLRKDEPITYDVCTVPGSVDDRVQRVLARRAREIKEMV